MTEGKPKFTPAPWQVVEGGWVRGSDGKDLAAICYCEECDANMALIAAAPEMYDALNGASAFLRAFADVLEETMKHDSRKEYAEDALRLAKGMKERADRIDALLRKARGEA